MLVTIYREFHNVFHELQIFVTEDQRTDLNGVVHSHRKTEKKFFLTTRDVRCVHYG